MDKNITLRKEPKQGRMEALRELPDHILRSLDKEEIRAFLFEDDWPDSLAEKLKDYVIGN
ncbi:conserved hypothetical protein [uncultured Desulfobacterium sp.]|uniref:Uncharacterized protein n=1 Tax=uncultured Desulfobacterium sp. TaxID=201089 RepID=A0A445MWJ9_9BACT|nr:conserved hypothetical protein [uncultured Desulfobacterium sp.]